MTVSKLANIVERFQSGELETTRSFPCPNCGGVARAQAVLVKSGPRSGLLGVSIYCDACVSGIEADGIEPWVGWEQIELPPEQQADPKLSLHELIAWHRKTHG